LENVFSIDANGFVSINESNYDGTDITVRVKGITEFNTALYKPITITNKCPTETATVKSDATTGTQGITIFSYVTGAAATTFPMTDLFTHSGEANCHYSGGDAYSFVDSDGTTPISRPELTLTNPTGLLAAASATFDPTNYVAGDDIVIKIRYVTWFNYPTPLYYTITARDQCK
jgi:hypothetical protein